MTVEILHGDCLEHLAALKTAGRTFASIVTDPPYHLATIGRSLQLSKNGDGTDRTQQRNYRERAFQGKAWDGGEIAFRPDTWRAALDVLEPGGMLAAFAGSRTQHRVAVAIEDAGFQLFDCALWLKGNGFPKARTQLKPSYEPIILARKPTKGRLRPLGIEACRTDHQNGWPPNILHDGSDEILAALGSKACFFYAATASQAERAGSEHPTVKPLSLVSWVVRLVTPPGGTVLDCFAGSGTTGLACQMAGFDCVLVEREAEYIEDCRRRLALPEIAAE